MKREFHFAILAVTLTLVLVACNAPIEIKAPIDSTTSILVTTDPPVPSPSPSPTASPAQPRVQQPGDKPLSQVRSENVVSIQIEISRDSQPPEWPDPVKTITGADDIRRIVDALRSVQIIRQLKENDSFYSTTFPVGANGFSVCYYLNDDSVVSFYLYDDVYFSMDAVGYAVNKLPQSMDSLYNAMDYKEQMLSEEKQHDSSNLFEIDGWRYFAADGEGAYQGQVGHLRGHKNGEEDHVLDLLSLQPVRAWTDGRRIVYVGYESKDKLQPDQQVFLSALPDGSDRRVLPTLNGVFQDPCWDDNKLYYLGWSQGDIYPKPLYRANADFSNHAKFMDIPGPLVTVQKGSIYCLSEDRRSLLQLPNGETVKTFEQPIKSFVYVSAFMHYEFIDENGRHFSWKQ